MYRDKGADVGAVLLLFVVVGLVIRCLCLTAQDAVHRHHAQSYCFRLECPAGTERMYDSGVDKPAEACMCVVPAGKDQ